MLWLQCVGPLAEPEALDWHREWPVGFDYLAFSDQHRALRASGMRHIDFGFSGSSAD